MLLTEAMIPPTDSSPRLHVEDMAAVVMADRDVDPPKVAEALKDQADFLA
jgi:hypothetical protein